MSAIVDKLPKTMPAVMAHGPHDYRFEERTVPKPGPGEVLLKVQSTGVCASDIKCYTGAPLFWGDEHTDRVLPAAGDAWPRVCR